MPVQICCAALMAAPTCSAESCQGKVVQAEATFKQAMEGFSARLHSCMQRCQHLAQDSLGGSDNESKVAVRSPSPPQSSSRGCPALTIATDCHMCTRCLASCSLSVRCMNLGRQKTPVSGATLQLAGSPHHHHLLQQGHVQPPLQRGDAGSISHSYVTR